MSFFDLTEWYFQYQPTYSDAEIYQSDVKHIMKLLIKINNASFECLDIHYQYPTRFNTSDNVFLNFHNNCYSTYIYYLCYKHNSNWYYANHWVIINCSMQQNCCKYIYKKWNYENNKNIPLINQNASDREMFNQWLIPLINWPILFWLLSNLCFVGSLSSYIIPTSSPPFCKINKIQFHINRQLIII